jgi:hypothetical protein
MEASITTKRHGHSILSLKTTSNGNKERMLKVLREKKNK